MLSLSLIQLPASVVLLVANRLSFGTDEQSSHISPSLPQRPAPVKAGLAEPAKARSQPHLTREAGAGGRAGAHRWLGPAGGRRGAGAPLGSGALDQSRGWSEPVAPTRPGQQETHWVALGAWTSHPDPLLRESSTVCFFLPSQ